MSFANGALQWSIGVRTRLMRAEPAKTEAGCQAIDGSIPALASTGKISFSLPLLIESVGAAAVRSRAGVGLGRRQTAPSDSRSRSERTAANSQLALQG